jgi:hypothetical protein
MKKAFLGLCLAALVLPLFADDAIVLPKGVFRLRAIPSYSMTDKAYDSQGDLEASIADGGVTALSGTFELGIVDPVTFGVRWAPGYYLSSDFTTAGYEKMAYTGPADLEIGMKIQALGSQGFAKSDKFRLAFTPGVGIPLDSYDAQAEWKNKLAGDDFRASSSSGHQSLYFGFKADADYLIDSVFSLNLHGQALYFNPNESLQFLTIATYWGAYQKAYAGYLASAPGDTAGAATYAAGQAQAYSPMTETKTEYGVETMFEFEPRAALPIGSAATLNLGLPLTYLYNLGDKVTYNGKTTTQDDETFLAIGPKASIMTKIGPLPVEAEAQYTLPLMGKNSEHTSTITLQLKIFGKIL